MREKETEYRKRMKFELSYLSVEERLKADSGLAMLARGKVGGQLAQCIHGRESHARVLQRQIGAGWDAGWTGRVAEGRGCREVEGVGECD